MLTGLDICKFIVENGDGVLSVSPLSKAESFFQRLLDKDQVICKFRKGHLVAILAYYRTNAPRNEVVNEEEWSLPLDYDQGKYLFVDQVVVHRNHRNTNILNSLIAHTRQLKPAFKKAFWLEVDGKWRSEERSQNMQTNCGILAFDKIAGVLNGRANVISLHTLTQMAQDNEFLLYPLRVNSQHLTQIETPFILHDDFHFETIRDHYELFGRDLPSEVYVLSNSFDIGVIIEEEEAKGIRGSKGKKFFKQIAAPIFDPVFSPFYTGAKDPLQKSLGNVAALGTGAVLGGPIGLAAGPINSLNQAKDLSSSGNIGGSFLTGGLTGAGAGLGTGSGLVGKLGSGLSSALTGSGGGATAGLVKSAVPSSVSQGAPTAGSGGLGGGLLSKIGLGGGSAAGASGAVGGAVPAQSGGLASNLFNTKSLLSTILGGGLLAYGNSQKNPNITLPEGYQNLTDQVQSGVTQGGLSGAGQAANTALEKGIKAGPDGIYPAADDSYFQSLLRQQREQSSYQRENTLRDVNRIAGGTQSSEALQVLNRFDRQQQQSEQDQIAKYLESQRQVGLDAHEKYIQLALQGDQVGYDSLIKALGSKNEADLAIQLYQAGLKAGRTSDISNLGGSLLSYGVAPQYQQAGELLKGIR